MQTVMKRKHDFAVPVSSNVDFNIKIVTRDKEGQLIIIKDQSILKM